jgi:hypothetical protein
MVGISLLRSRYVQNNTACFICGPFALRRFSRCRTNDDLGSRRRKGTHQLIQRDIRCSPFNLGYARLTRVHPLAKFLLGHVDRLSLQTNCPSERDSCVKQLALVRTHTQKISGIADFPASRFNRFAFCSIHQLAFHSRLLFLCCLYGCIVLFQSLLAPLDDFVRYFSCFLRVDLQDENRVRVNAIHDAPIVLSIPNSKRTAPCTHVGQRFRLWHAQSLAFLEQSKEHSGFLSCLGCEWRCLDLSMKPNQRLSSCFVVLDLLRLGHYPYAPCLPTPVYIGYDISSSEKNLGLNGIFRLGGVT